MKAVLGIGTNIGDRLKNIEEAYESLSLVPGIELLRKSSVYETEPWGYVDQPNFYNTVVEIETELSPNALLGVCLGIEAAMGRVREFKNGPRVIDVDLLVYEGRTSDTRELQLPHPRIGERAFVLVPLSELFTDLNVFGNLYKKSYDALLNIDTANKVEKS